jgi:hypothetical protein
MTLKLDCYQKTNKKATPQRVAKDKSSGELLPEVIAVFRGQAYMLFWNSLGGLLKLNQPVLMLFFNHFEHILRHAVEVPLRIPAPLFAGGGVVHFVGPRIGDALF